MNAKATPLLLSASSTWSSDVACCSGVLASSFTRSFSESTFSCFDDLEYSTSCLFSTCQLANLDVLKLAGLPHLSHQIKKTMRRLHLVLQQNTGKPCPQLTHLCLSLYGWQLPCHLHVRVWNLISKLGHQKCLRLEQQPSESTDIMHRRQGTQNVCRKPGEFQFCNWRPRLANTKGQPSKCRVPCSDQWLPGPGTHANFFTSLLKMSFAIKNRRHGNRREDIKSNCEVVSVNDVQQKLIEIMYREKYVCNM